MNSITVEREVGSKMFGKMEDHGYPANLPPAPPECVEACNQQHDRTRVLHNDLIEAGITPNVAIPETTAPGTSRITGAVPANQQAIDQSQQPENGHE